MLVPRGQGRDTVAAAQTPVPAQTPLDGASSPRMARGDTAPLSLLPRGTLSLVPRGGHCPHCPHCPCCHRGHCPSQQGGDTVPATLSLVPRARCEAGVGALVNPGSHKQGRGPPCDTPIPPSKASTLLMEQPPLQTPGVLGWGTPSAPSPLPVPCTPQRVTCTDLQAPSCLWVCPPTAENLPEQSPSPKSPEKCNHHWRKSLRICWEKSCRSEKKKKKSCLFLGSSMDWPRSCSLGSIQTLNFNYEQDSTRDREMRRGTGQ